MKKCVSFRNIPLCIKSLTCKGLVPLADAVGFSTEPLNVFQIGFRVEKPLCLWWRGHEHGSCGLLHNRLTCWALAGVRRGCLLSWRAEDPYLQWQSDGQITLGGTAGKPLHISASGHPHAMEFQHKMMSKGKRTFSWKTPASARALWCSHRHVQREEVQTNHIHCSYFSSV